MITTVQLFGPDQMVKMKQGKKDPDFDVKPGSRSKKPGARLIWKIFEFGYDGVDMSLFDVDEGIIQAIQDGVAQAKIKKFNFKPVLGFTAAAWKGISSEGTMTFQKAFLRAQAVSDKLNKIDLLLKVDEPGCFRAIKEYYSPYIGEAFLRQGHRDFHSPFYQAGAEEMIRQTGPGMFAFENHNIRYKEKAEEEVIVRRQIQVSSDVLEQLLKAKKRGIEIDLANPSRHIEESHKEFSVMEATFKPARGAEKIYPEPSMFEFSKNLNQFNHGL